MNEELQTQLAGVISALANTVQKTADFTVEQLPDIVTQYVAYGRVQATTVTVSFVILLVAFLVLLFRYGVFAQQDPDRHYWSDVRIASFWVGSTGSVIAFLCLAITTSDFIMVWLAPKVWLLKSLANLVK